MTVRGYAVAGLVALVTTGCDVQQKTPEVGATAALPATGVLARRASPADVSDSPLESARSEQRGTRLFGRGIDRDRQVRL